MLRSLPLDAFRRPLRIAVLFVLGFLIIAAKAPTRQAGDEVQRLVALGQIWGFLKYFHPEVATGKLHWDSVLVVTVPKVRSARSNADFNATIASLLDTAGAVRLCPERYDRSAVAERCRTTFPDSMRKNIDFRWLTASTLLSAENVRRLNFIRDNRHQGAGKYVQFQSAAMFLSDTAFNQPVFPQAEIRLLALFRFWNAARYFFPYMYVNGGDWNTVLAEFTPRMLSANNATEYHLAALEMTTRLRDTHVSTGSRLLREVIGARIAAFEARSIDGSVVVWRVAPGTASDSMGVQVGDVITHLDGMSVSQRRRERTPLIPAGNPASLERKLAQLVLRTNADSMTYTIERDGRTIARRMATVPFGAAATGLPKYQITELVKILPNSNIGYVNMGDIELAQVDSAMAIVKATDGLIMDVRNYPRGTMYRFAEHLNPSNRPFAKFTTVDPTHPGQVVWMPPVRAGKQGGNDDYYRGRVAILADERSQSHAEFTIMAMQTAPQSKVIGSQTAGADGNVTRFSLPGGVGSLFTGLGVYYPDGRPTQRIGIVPDIEVRPTLRGVRAGRDEVLERAIAYIRTGR